jgi:TolA-binding protein
MVISVKAFISVFVALSLFLAAGCAVLAKDSTISGAPRKENIAQRIEERKLALLSAANKNEGKLMELKAKIASRTAELKSRLQGFKDQKKAERVQKVNDVLNKINKNQTDQMSKHLGKMSDILLKVENRVNGASGSGSVTEANNALSSASAAIATAKAAVTTQSNKDYTLTITNEASAGAQARIMRDQLHTDLLSVRKVVIDAKQSVANAIRVTATTLGGIK